MTDLATRKTIWRDRLVVAVPTNDEDQLYEVTLELRFLLRAVQTGDEAKIQSHRLRLIEVWDSIDVAWIDAWISEFSDLQFGSEVPEGQDLMNWLFDASTTLASKCA